MEMKEWFVPFRYVKYALAFLFRELVFLFASSIEPWYFFFKESFLVILIF